MKQIKLILISLSILLSILFYQNSYTQDNETMAISYYQQAEKSYTNNDMKKTINYLDKAIELLGSTNSKIEYLYVKTCIRLANEETKMNLFLSKWNLAKEHSQKYFEVTPKGTNTKEYSEMATSVITIDEGIESALKIEECQRCKGKGRYEYEQTCDYCYKDKCCEEGNIIYEDPCFNCSKGKVPDKYTFMGDVKTYKDCPECEGYGKKFRTVDCTKCDKGIKIVEKNCSDCQGVGYYRN
jgi:hypothetical protein